AVCLSAPLKTFARMAAVEAFYREWPSLRAAWPFARRTGGQGVGAVLLATVGLEVLLVTLFLAALAYQGTAGWEEVVGLGGMAFGLLSLGAFGLGAVALKGERWEEAREGTLGLFAT